MEILKSLVVVMLDNHLWTARKKLRPEDLKAAAASNLPPETLASLGSKKVCDPNELKGFASLKKRAERACETVGVRFLGGYAVPSDKLDGLLGELRAIEAEAAEEKRQFLIRYDSVIQQWIAENDEWREIILRAVEPASHVSRQIRFGHQAFRIGAAGDEGAESNEGLEEEISGLGDRLIYEISRDANRLWEVSLQGRDKVTQKALRPLRAILAKLQGLVFLDTRIRPMIRRIEAGLAALPKSGNIEGQDLNLLAGLVLQLADPKGMRKVVGSIPTAPEETEAEEIASPELPEEEEEESPMTEDRKVPSMEGFVLF